MSHAKIFTHCELNLSIYLAFVDVDKVRTTV